MKRIIIASLVGVFALFVGFAFHVIQDQEKPNLPGSVVKVLLEQGHGSGVHIGKGYIVTAAHVVAGNKTVKIKTDKGGEDEADVLWFNRDYDIALIRTNAKLQTSRISCEPLPHGSITHAIGNPSNQEFISTWGRVSGHAIDTPWKVAIVADITIVPGMSGGGLFDESDRLVGILVGTMARGMGGLIPVGYVVPTSAFCGMLGR